MLIIGLTGGIGCGKSVVARHFAALGIDVIDADAIAHEVVTPGQPTLAEISRCFGPAILTPGGELDRARLRDMVFADPDKRRTLESLMHPVIRSEMVRRAKHSRGPYCVLSIPLLLETHQQDLVDRILVVDCSPETQRRRVAARDHLSDEAIDAVMAAQARRRERLATADDVIDNEGDLASLEAQVEALHLTYLRLAESAATR